MPIEWDDPTAAANAGSGTAKAVAAAGASLNAKAVASAKEETGKLLKAAGSGGFRISESACAPLRQALADMQRRLDELTAKTVMVLGQAPRLGSHAYGLAVARHDQKGGTADTRSAAVVLEQFRQILGDAHKALELAEKNYREHEGETARRMTAG